MTFGPVDAELDLPALEAAVLERWAREDIERRTREHRRQGEPWVFYEGPPTANGLPGLHHVWARVFKDLYPRFQTMRGKQVPRKGGWDCHGLPVELEVEKELGLATKHEIEAYGIAAFNQRCRESVQRYVGDWTELTRRSGTWIDTEDAYWTLSNDYIESVWWLVGQLWERDLLYEGHRVVPYCARCGTALSSHELGQPGAYRDVVDPSVYVRFPLRDDDADLLVWTTTPWTLISNVAAAVGPDIDYVRVPADTLGTTGRDLILAEARLPEGADTRVTERRTGKDLVGRSYVRPFDLLDLDAGSDGEAWRVLAADFVSTEDGSGIVHLAPAFGEDDHRVCAEAGLGVLNPVNAQGAFDDRVIPWAGVFVKDADRGIVDDLDARGLLVREEHYEHSYPHCWRCSTPLIYWAKTSWFVRTSSRRELLLAENETIGWHPPAIKHGRFGNWLEGNVDWALSRDRYWGTPLPVWRCEDCATDTCVSSLADLEARSGQDLGTLDLHRPHVDEIQVSCSACGGTARRVEPVLDAWFDSGSMPSAQFHHPFGDDSAFEGAFPADFICEAIDQTRGWFYSLLAVNALVFGSTPYRNVVCLGLVVDEHGQKMSKSRGNVIDPFEIFDRHGADALRWYFFASGQPWTPRRVGDDGIRESTRQTLLTLWNCWSFFATYADADGWEPEVDEDTPPTHVLDRWILSRCDGTIAAVTAALEAFDALGGAGAIATFVDDLSNWYVRRSRPRFWQSADGAAHRTLHRCLVTITELLAPFCPFLADELYVALTGAPSVHLADWPTPAGWQDTELEQQMAAARRLVTLGRSARSDAKAKVRQPLRRALLLHGGPTLDDEVRAEIASELNVKVLEDIEGLSGLMTWTVAPNFRALGPRLGPKVNEVKAALADADGSALRSRLEADGAVEVAGERLTADELELRAARHEAFALAEEDGWAVALDLELDEELRREGQARELVRVLNEHRKTSGLAITDRISLTLELPEALREAFTAHGDAVAADVLATEVRTGAGTDALVVDGETVHVTITRV